MKRSGPIKRKPTKEREPKLNRLGNPVCSVNRKRSKHSNGPARSLQGGPYLCASHAEERADRLFSKWVRARDGRCTIAPVVHTPCDDFPLQACHIEGRRKQVLRYSPANVHAGCRTHHRLVDEHEATIKVDWALHVLGDLQYRELRVRARQTANRLDAALSALAWLEGEK